eukprot:10963155-Ditylum_brightwellii.AAC.1
MNQYAMQENLWQLVQWQPFLPAKMKCPRNSNKHISCILQDYLRKSVDFSNFPLESNWTKNFARIHPA